MPYNPNNPPDVVRKLPKNKQRQCRWDGFIGKKFGRLTIGSILPPNHLESWDSSKKLRLNVANGETVCENCHKEFHRLYGRGKNTKNQFDDFKRRKKYAI